MNSQQPKLSRSHRQLADLDENLRQQIAQNLQLSRLLWLLVKQNPDAVITLDEATIHPLWELDFKRPTPEQQTVVTIGANQMPEPTDDQLRKLADRLLGSAKHPSDDMLAVGLGDYPFAYVSGMLAPRVVFHEGRWVAREEFDKLKELAPPP